MEYLDKIGQSHFGVPPPERPPQGGLFGGLLDSFFNVLNEDEEDEEEGNRWESFATVKLSTHQRIIIINNKSHRNLNRLSSGPSRPLAQGASSSSSRPARMETEDLD